MCCERQIFISIGGIDGAGKTRLARALSRRLNGLYRKQCVGPSFNRMLQAHPDFHFRIPIAQPVAQHLCDCYVEDFLKYAERYGPCRNPSGRLVIFDRWKTCVRAFAQVFASDRTGSIQRLSAVSDPVLDVVVDVPVSLAVSRIQRRGKRDADEERSILTRLRRAYVDIAAKGHVVVVDGRRPFLTVLEDTERHFAARLSAMSINS